jgi:hypothetical protein
VKQEMIVTLVMMVTMYDLDVKATRESLKMSSGRFGFGVLEPRKRVPFSISIRNRSLQP